MAELKINPSNPDDISRNGRSGVQALSIEILNSANQVIPQVEFLRGICLLMIDYSQGETFEIILNEKNKFRRCRVRQGDPDSYRYEAIEAISSDKGAMMPVIEDSPQLSQAINTIIDGGMDLETISPAADSGETPATATIPIKVDNRLMGFIHVSQTRDGFWARSDIAQYRDIARIIGIAVINHKAQLDLRERLKELSCAYRIAQVADEPGKPLDEILQYIVTLLPSAWMYPEIATSRIIIDGRSYNTPEFRAARYKQSSYIVIKSVIRGAVEVYYLEKRPELDEGPFLSEERKLIDNIARQVASLVEKKEAESEKAQLQAQIRHADRLATIGQLAAGVAHEINEPLGNILGFAQLLQKNEGLPDQAVQDIEKIVGASLHAREIIKKLMLFARQTPSQRNALNLNAIVEEGLYFFEARCAKAEISVIKSLSSTIPDINGDQTQLRQVLVNLVVNAIQAMPNGGKLFIQTYADKASVYLAVEDTGSGMSEEVMKKIFIPFYTTKDISEGTGLGLAVVHGIVTLHRGSIEVKSEPDKGSQFIVKLPINQPGFMGE